ncbi:hypothetical protein AMATHDRAFT_46173 [Amanita thiersii Skay4041]|uniref:Fork-head domain-containing protein n=1 Tax=Amanita thiersii Skay4041 TaxID=703135 RepID=A0A2A9NQ08_9AGAR|nr:hypothetical protein AMATHDRAFT_46173 [Amanita thiersii Skay4041]
MDTPARSVTPSTDVQVKQEPSPLGQEKISAYYSLVFPHFTFYIQTLSVTIGRRCAPNSHAASSSTAEPLQVDVDLGALKSVSRLHAKIEYDQDEDRFVLVVIGRNGAWVDGVWTASGTRAPLGDRSQIQIASRVFHFVLPPPPPPEDSPSPSSHSSSGVARARSPSLDIETISPPSSEPSNSPSPVEHKLPSPPPEPQIESASSSQPSLPNSNAIGKSLMPNNNHANSPSNVKKRKKSEAETQLIERPKPEDMPPKPPFTYAQLIYRAIRDTGGKATLQEICAWISRTYDYYKYADGAWMSSVRHNLSSGRAFMKMERCGGDRGKGFFWSIDEKYAQTFEEQEAKMLQAAANPGTPGSASKDKGGRKRDKGAPLSDPPLKRSVKGDTKGLPLPPPLTNTPLAFKSAMQATGNAVGSTSTSVKATTSSLNSSVPTNSAITISTPPTTGVFAYPTHPHTTHMVTMPPGSTMTPNYSGTPNPYAALTQTHWGIHRPTSGTIAEAQSAASEASGSVSSYAASSVGQSSAAQLPSSATQQLYSQMLPPSTIPQLSSVSEVSQPQQPIVPDVVIPIVLGPIPPTHPDYSPSHRNNSVKEGYMILHERKLILDPDVFSGLTPEMLMELEGMGARAALVVLTGHMVRALKEKRAREREKGKERGARRGRALGRGGTTRKGGTNPTPGGTKLAESSGSPFTHQPLEKRGTDPPQPPYTSNDKASQITSGPSTVSNCIKTNEEVTLAPADPDSLIVVVDDSDEDGPATKRRKVGNDIVNLQQLPTTMV